MQHEEHIILFGPRNGKMLKHAHPELALHPEFKDLSNEEFYFVWLYASQSSSINPDLAEAIRADISARKAITDPDKQATYSALDFPEKIKEAIEKMKVFSPDARYVAKRTIQDIFHNIQRMAKVDMDDFVETDEDGNKKINWAGRKQYVDSAAKISEFLPNLLVQLEQGFGIDVKTGKEMNDEKTIDLFHKRKKENLS